MGQKHRAFNPKVGLLLGKWRKQRPNIKPALRQHVNKLLTLYSKTYLFCRDLSLFFAIPNLLMEVTVTSVCVQRVTAAKNVRFVSRFYCIHKLFFYQARIMLIAVFHNTHTVINVFLTLQMYGYWVLEEISILDEKYIDNCLIQLFVHCQYQYFYFPC